MVASGLWRLVTNHGVAAGEGRRLAHGHGLGRRLCRYGFGLLTKETDPSIVSDVVQVEVIELFSDLEDATEDANVALVQRSCVA